MVVIMSRCFVILSFLFIFNTAQVSMTDALGADDPTLNGDDLVKPSDEMSIIGPITPLDPHQGGGANGITVRPLPVDKFLSGRN